MELKISFTIFCLILESILAQSNYVPTGVRRFEMYVGNNDLCGGREVKIKLRDSRGITCETKASRGFAKNTIVTWSGYRSGTCRNNMIIDGSTKVQIATESSSVLSSFCPRKILLYTQDGENFVTRIQHTNQWYDRDTNQRDHDISRSVQSGIKKITLKIKNEDCGWITYNGGYVRDDCGGGNIRLKVQTGNEYCYVEEIDYIWKNHFAIWSGDQLNNCEGMNIDSAYSTISVETRMPQNQFGIALVQILMSDSYDTLYEVLNIEVGTFPQHGTLRSGRPRRFQLKKLWPPAGGVPVRSRQLVCPREDEDACPTHELFAYRIHSRENMNCAFECDRVTRTPYSTNMDITDGTGFRCVQTTFTSSQFGYCCMTRRTNGGIPYCPDVVNGTGQTQTQEQFQQETNIECPDPGVGCPIDSIEQYFDSPPQQVSYDCQPECDFLDGPVRPDTSKSGFHCTQLRRSKRETKFCCNAQGASTSLPNCQTRRNNARNSENAIDQRTNNQVGNQGNSNYPNYQGNSNYPNYQGNSNYPNYQGSQQLESQNRNSGDHYRG